MNFIVVLRGIAALRGRLEQPSLSDERAVARSTTLVSYSVLARRRPMDGSVLQEFTLFDDERAALVGHFDMYGLGYRRVADAEPLDAHWSQIEEVLGWLHARYEARLSACSHVQFMRAVALHARDGQLKAALTDRYHAACACAEIPFWKGAQLELPDQSAWSAYKPFLARSMTSPSGPMPRSRTRRLSRARVDEMRCLT